MYVSTLCFKVTSGSATKIKVDIGVKKSVTLVYISLANNNILIIYVRAKRRNNNNQPIKLKSKKQKYELIKKII